MAENCTYVESLGTEICSYHLQGINQIVGRQQRMFVMDDAAKLECGITPKPNGSNSEEIANLEREIANLQSSIDSAGDVFVENAPIYNTYLNAVNFVNSLVEPYFLWYEWATSESQNLVSDYSNGLVDKEYYEYWFNYYTTMTNNVVADIQETLYAYDYEFLVSQRDYYYNIVITALVYVSGGYTLSPDHPLYNEPSNQEKIEQLQNQIDGLLSQTPPENLDIDPNCIEENAETPITIFNLRGITEGMVIPLRVTYDKNDYLMEFRISEISPSIVEVMGRDEEVSVLFGNFNNFSNLFAALSAIDPSLKNMKYDMLEQQNITITLLEN